RRTHRRAGRGNCGGAPARARRRVTDRTNGSAAGATRIEVGGPAPYPVLVGSGLLPQLRALLPRAMRVAIIHPPTLRQLADSACEQLADVAVSLLEVPDGEGAKTLEVASRCWDALAAAGFTRSDA